MYSIVVMAVQIFQKGFDQFVLGFDNTLKVGDGIGQLLECGGEGLILVGGGVEFQTAEPIKRDLGGNAEFDDIVKRGGF